MGKLLIAGKPLPTKKSSGRGRKVYDADTVCRAFGLRNAFLQDTEAFSSVTALADHMLDLTAEVEELSRTLGNAA